MSTELDTSGLDAFLAGLDAANDAAAEESARDIETEAQSIVPVDTGALRASIEVFGAAGSGRRTVESGQSLDYAPDVEFGTPDQRAQPFMTPAAEHSTFAAIWAKHLNTLAKQSST